MTEPLDAVAPWTIKAVATSTRKAVIAASQKENLTVGQWLEKRVSEWLEDGGPVRIDTVSASAQPTVSPAVVMEMLANMGRAGVVAQKGVGVLANRLVKRTMQEVLQPAKRQEQTLALSPPT